MDLGGDGVDPPAGIPGRSIRQSGPARRCRRSRRVAGAHLAVQRVKPLPRPAWSAGGSSRSPPEPVAVPAAPRPRRAPDRPHVVRAKRPLRPKSFEPQECAIRSKLNLQNARRALLSALLKFKHNIAQTVFSSKVWETRSTDVLVSAFSIARRDPPLGSSFRLRSSAGCRLAAGP